MPREPFAGRVRTRTILKLAAFLALLVAANYVVHWVAGALNLQVRPITEDALHRIIMLSAIAYTILLAIPFIPGVEIAIGLIVMLGPKIVWLVYACTLVGLFLGYCIGRLVPLSGLIRFLDALYLSQASGLLQRIAPLKRKERLDFLLSQAPNLYVPFLLKHRYIALALAINLPGNFLIGGGGGIALVAGMSRLFSVVGFILTTAIAVLPVPLGVHFFGAGILSR